MAKINTAKVTKTVPDGTNLAGGAAFNYPPKLELAIRCATTFLGEDLYYANGTQIRDQITLLAQKIGSKEPEFVMKLACWLRNDMAMRSVSQWLLAVMAAHPDYVGKPKPWLREYGPMIMRRADEVAEVLAAYNTLQPGQPVPRSLYAAIAQRLERLKEYEAIKYRMRGNQWSLADVIRVAHVKPRNAKQAKLQAWVLDSNCLSIEEAEDLSLNSLASWMRINSADSFEEVVGLIQPGTSTWETIVSKFGSTPEVWKAAAEVMPPFAYVRNLRNLLKHGVEIDVDRIVAAGENDMILPFRFLTARDVLVGNGRRQYNYWVPSPVEEVEFPDKDRQMVLAALDKAIDLSVANMPELGNTATLVDVSGSMTGSLSNRGTTMMADVARLFGAAAFKRSEAGLIIPFSDDAKIVKGIDKNDRTFSIVDKIQVYGGGTATAKALALTNKYLDKIDTVVIFTDCESWVSGFYDGRSVQAWEVAKDLLNKKRSLHIVHVNLAPYGQSDLAPHPRVLNIGGWNDSVLKLIEVWGCSGDKDVLVKTIENWKPKWERDEEDSEDS